MEFLNNPMLFTENVKPIKTVDEEGRKQDRCIQQEASSVLCLKTIDRLFQKWTSM